MRVALLCSGLGHVHRGHEVFARDLFSLLSGHLDMTLFKGGGTPADRERVIPNLPRNSPLLREVHVAATPRWASAVREQEQIRIEGQTFAYAALQPLIEGGYDVVHCLEQEVCDVIYDNRHLFPRPPKVLFSNGGAIEAADLPRCDFVQEHTRHNWRRSARRKAFVIPHGVDLERFRPVRDLSLRRRLGVADDARLLISVGTICYWHKRMDYVIEEVATLPDTHLLIVGQESADSAAIKALGRERMPGRVHFLTLEHHELPMAYAAADCFVLGSLFETFGIVYIEALAMGLPVFCTDHANQRDIVKEGIFVDMRRRGALATALRQTAPERLRQLSQRGPQIAAEHYDLLRLRQSYIDHYARIAGAPSSLPAAGTGHRLGAHSRNAWRQARRLWGRVRA